MGLAGRCAIVTGATSGIGRAVAIALASAGASVLATGRDAERGAATVREAGARCAFLAGDVVDPAFGEAAAGEAVRRFGRLDVLVNAAGVIHVGDAEHTSPREWRDVLSVNLDGAFYMSRAAVPHLRASGGGAIVNIGSDYSLMAGPQAVAYCASKGALLQMTKAMALDHAKEGIRVNIVCPTVVDTPMIDDIAAKKGTPAAELRQAYDAYVPTGRMVTAQEVAEAVLFLAGDGARQITGIALPVDGGTTAM